MPTLRKLCQLMLLMMGDSGAKRQTSVLRETATSLTPTSCRRPWQSRVPRYQQTAGSSGSDGKRLRTDTPARGSQTTAQRSAP